MDCGSNRKREGNGGRDTNGARSARMDWETKGAQTTEWIGDSTGEGEEAEDPTSGNEGRICSSPQSDLWRTGDTTPTPRVGAGYDSKQRV